MDFLKLSQNFFDVYMSRRTSFLFEQTFICQDGQDTLFNKTVQFDVCIFLP